MDQDDIKEILSVQKEAIKMALEDDELITLQAKTASKLFGAFCAENFSLEGSLALTIACMGRAGALR
jgi:hypothetical protein